MFIAIKVYSEGCKDKDLLQAIIFSYFSVIGFGVAISKASKNKFFVFFVKSFPARGGEECRSKGVSLADARDF
ncbi:MAG: hypothetical protein QXT86_13470 [Archaeoglobaceae archaeon]